MHNKIHRIDSKKSLKHKEKFNKFMQKTIQTLVIHEAKFDLPLKREFPRKKVITQGKTHKLSQHYHNEPLMVYMRENSKLHRRYLLRFLALKYL